MANVQVRDRGKGFSNSSALLLAGLHKDVAVLGHLAINYPWNIIYSVSTVPGLHTAFQFERVQHGSTFSQSISVPSSERRDRMPGERLRELGLAATILCQELRC